MKFEDLPIDRQSFHPQTRQARHYNPCPPHYTLALDLSKLHNDVLEEVRLLARDYSLLRRSNGKWRTGKGTPDGLQPSVSVKFAGSDAVVSILRKGETTADQYRASGLLERAGIRQNSMLLRAIHRLWTLINPYHLKGLSKKVFLHLNELVCRHILITDPRQTPHQIVQDVETDFGDRQSLVFHEFHESVFELLDNHARSKLATEYILLVRKICQHIEEENPFPTLDFHSKLHQTDSPRPSYKSWMKPHLTLHSRAPSPKSSPPPTLGPADPGYNSAFDRLSKKKTFVTRDPPLSRTAFRRVELLTKSQPSSPHRAWRASFTISRKAFRVASRRSMGRTGYLLQTSPLSTVSKSGRPVSSVLEDILRDRRKQRSTLSSEA